MRVLVTYKGGMKEPRNVVVTGVTRGLGRALARGLVAQGHRVIGCGTTEKGLASVRDELGEALDASLVDVSDDAAVAAWARLVTARQGVPDLLVNNAAIINRNAPLWKVGAREFSRVVDVNIKGVANVIRHFVPPMIRRRQGVIVNFSSGWGRSADAEVAPYCATKWAIEGLTQALAQELPVGMAAVALNPGVINTEMLRSCFGSSAQGFPKAEEWALKAVPFILKISERDNGRPLTAP